jgi:hypothetical protein
MSWFDQSKGKPSYEVPSPRSPTRNRRIARSVRTHQEIRESQLKAGGGGKKKGAAKSLVDRCKDFFEKVGGGGGSGGGDGEEGDMHINIKGIQEHGGAFVTKKRKVAFGPGDDDIKEDEEGVGEQNISARTDFTTDTSARSMSGGTDNGSKRDWWFPNKAAFGRKKVYQAQDLFNRLTRQSTNLRGFDSFLIRDSTDVLKIDNQQNEWTDRGRGYYYKQRKKNKHVALVETGLHAGRSLVQLAGIRNLTWHRLRHDAFSSLISMKFDKLVLMCCGFYVLIWFIFAFFWYTVFLAEPDCLVNFDGFLDSLVMSISTANTIGYGVRSIKPNLGTSIYCSYAVIVMSIERLVIIIADALLIGVLFSKLSQPKKRSRTIFISDSAVVCQRDGLLKFMFRVGDARGTTIIRPVIQAFLYTFNPSRRRRTLEGEYVPNRVAPLKLEVMDESLLLPVLASHVIDEKSPLFGMTKTAMEELKAEIVVTFIAVNSETGAEFAARQSYLASEIFFGFQFVKVIRTVRDDDDYKWHAIDLAHFHDIEPQKMWSNVLMTQNDISRILMNTIGHAHTVPTPVLGENSLVISGSAGLTLHNKQLKLRFRVGDVFPPLGQFLDAKVFAYYYPWRITETPEGARLDQFSCQELKLGTDSNPKNNSLFLRIPVIVEHTVDSSSPLSRWQTREGFVADSAAEILVIVYGTNQVTQQIERVQRTFKVTAGDVKCGYNFINIISSPQESLDGLPRIDYDLFHEMEREESRRGKVESGRSWVYSEEEPFESRKSSDNPADVPFQDPAQTLQTSHYSSGFDVKNDFTQLSQFFPETSSRSRSKKSDLG